MEREGAKEQVAAEEGENENPSFKKEKSGPARLDVVAGAEGVVSEPAEALFKAKREAESGGRAELPEAGGTEGKEIEQEDETEEDE